MLSWIVSQWKKIRILLFYWHCQLFPLKYSQLWLSMNLKLACLGSWRFVLNAANHTILNTIDSMYLFKYICRQRTKDCHYIWSFQYGTNGVKWVIEQNWCSDIFSLFSNMHLNFRKKKWSVCYADRLYC